MRLERKSEGKHAVVLALSGTIEGGPAAETFLSTIRQLILEGRRNVLLDLGGVSWINSTGLGILIGGHAALRRVGGSMKIVNLTDRVESLFAITKLNLVFDVFADEVTALRSFRPPPDV
jgi:anti-sigma B factor antagonist